MGVLETDRFPTQTHHGRDTASVLLEAPVLPTLLKLAAPNLLVMLAQMSIGLVEVYFVAHLGVDALAGASLVFPVLSLISALSQGAVGGGVVTAIARALGRGQHAQANQLVWHAVAIAAFFGLLTSAVILSAGPLFYRAMGGEGASLAVATTYSGIVFGHPRGDPGRRWRCRDQARSKPRSRLHGREPWHDELRLAKPA
jgi:Na+-driven multidrug efflux pump